MALIAPIVINDGAATPVAHTFNPVSVNPAQYREALANVPTVGQGMIGIKIGASNGAVQRVTLTLALPALEVPAGGTTAGYVAAPKAAYTNTVKAEFILPIRGTAAQRKDLRVLLLNLLANAQVIDAVDNMNVPY